MSGFGMPIREGGLCRTRWIGRRTQRNGRMSTTQKRHDIERNNFDVKFRLYQLGDQLDRGEDSWSDISQSLGELREQLEFSHSGLRELGCDVDAARDYNSIVDEYQRTLHRADVSGVQNEGRAVSEDMPLIPVAPTTDVGQQPQSPPRRRPCADSAVAVEVAVEEPKHDETLPETASAPPPVQSAPDVSPVEKIGRSMRNDDEDQGPQQPILSTNATHGLRQSQPIINNNGSSNDTHHSTPTRPGSQARSPVGPVELHKPPVFSPPPADPFSADSSDLRYQALIQENKNLQRQLELARRENEQLKQQPRPEPVDAFELCNLRTALDSLTNEQIRQHLDRLIEHHPKTDKDSLITILKHSYQRVKTQRDNLKIIRAYQSQQLYNYKIATSHRIKLLRSLGLDYQASTARSRPTFVSTIWAVRFMIRLRKTSAQTLQKQAFIRSLLENQQP